MQFISKYKCKWKGQSTHHCGTEAESLPITQCSQVQSLKGLTDNNPALQEIWVATDL